MYLTAINNGGILSPNGGFPSGSKESVCIGPGYVIYPSTSETRKSNHQHWMLPDSFGATLSNDYYANCLADTRGVVYQIRWGDYETTQGNYTWTTLTNALDYCASNNKKLIVRIYWKTYTDANDPPTIKSVPDYIKNDITTYGGTYGSYRDWETDRKSVV